MNILSIGNSFSQDAQRYLHQIAKMDGVSLQCFNLYIGGCSLEHHYRNMKSGDEEYVLEMNGMSTGFKVSLKKALLNRHWDVVTLQQASHKSPYYDSYQPYLDELVKFVRECVPGAKVVIHQTWAYEEDSKRLNQELGFAHHTDMFRDVKESYDKAAKDINADFIIPSGAVFEKLLENGIEKVHRDTFHVTLGLGRYALGLIWYMMLTGNDVENNTFCDFDEAVTAEEIKIAKESVKEVYEEYKN